MNPKYIYYSFKISYNLSIRTILITRLKFLTVALKLYVPLGMSLISRSTSPLGAVIVILVSFIKYKVLIPLTSGAIRLGTIQSILYPLSCITLGEKSAYTPFSAIVGISGYTI